MSLFSALTAKPWTQDAVTDIPAWGRLPLATPKVGLGLFLAVVTVLFSLLISAYFMRMMHPDWRPLPEPPVLWANTLMLVLSSVALHWSWVGARRDDRFAVRAGFIAGTVFAVAFLVGQLVAWRQLGELGYFVATNPANTFFYLLTALHGLHLLGGMVALGRSAVKLRSGDDPRAMRQSIELCTFYWHFLLVVWVVLFALLLADNQGKFAMGGMHQGS